MSRGSSNNPLPGDFPKTPKPLLRTPSRGRTRAVTRSQTASRVTSQAPESEGESLSDLETYEQTRPISPRPPTPSKETSPTPQLPKMTESSCKIPTLDVKLSGASTYSEWTISIKNYLKLVPIGDNRIWDVITGDYSEPAEIKKEKTSSSSATSNKKERRT